MRGRGSSDTRCVYLYIEGAADMTNDKYDLAPLRLSGSALTTLLMREKAIIEFNSKRETRFDAWNASDSHSISTGTVRYCIDLELALVLVYNSYNPRFSLEQVAFICFVGQ